MQQRPLTPRLFPVDQAKGNREDMLVSRTLEQYLDKHKPIAEEAELIERERVVTRISEIFRKWVHETIVSKGMPEDVADRAGGAIFTSGSYRIGVHEPGADIDTICVAPAGYAGSELVTREDFFGRLKEMLLAEPGVTEMVAVESAMVPIMSFNFREVPIDLLLALLPTLSVPADINIDLDKVLVGVDQATEKSLNGPRVTNMLVKLLHFSKDVAGKEVLSAEDVAQRWQTFLICLRAVRLWAKARGIYSNKMGYLGGVNWSILLVPVCQMFPHFPPSLLLEKFFLVYSTWKWPQPLKLVEPYHAEGLDLKVWDPRMDPRDARHVMPILTPAYPSMNSSLSVNRATLKVLTAEFGRALNTFARTIKPTVMKAYISNLQRAKLERRRSTNGGAAKQEKGEEKVKLEVGESSSSSRRSVKMEDEEVLVEKSSSHEADQAAVEKQEAAIEGGDFRVEASEVVKISEHPAVENAWAELFRPSDMFVKFPAYLVVIITGKDEDALRGWCGFIESRLRKLVEGLSMLPFKRVRNWPKPVKLEVGCSLGKQYEISNPHNACFFIGLEVNTERVRGQILNLSHPIKAFRDKCLQVWTDQGYDMSEGQAPTIEYQHLKWKYMPAAVMERYGGVEAAKELHEKLVPKKKKKKKKSKKDDAAAASSAVKPEEVASEAGGAEDEPEVDAEKAAELAAAAAADDEDVDHDAALHRGGDDEARDEEDGTLPASSPAKLKAKAVAVNKKRKETTQEGSGSTSSSSSSSSVIRSKPKRMKISLKKRK